jgi:RimJ/RimL family protein N-acetyltransferase
MSGERKIPIIETARLRLRGHRVEDFRDCAAMWADPGVVQHIGGRPFAAEETWAKILRYAGLWSLLGFGYWAVEENASGRYAGDVGFADFKREVQPSLDGAPELGWALMPRAQGHGLATEAVGAAAAWSDRHLRAVRTVCMIDPGNAASMRVAEKCGYREYARATYKGQPTILYERRGGGR